MMAIKEALSWLKNDFIDTLDRDVEIFSDSLSAVTVLNGFEARDSLCLDTMILLRDSPQVTLNWIKGHSNITGNEYADTLARRGATDARYIAFAAPYMPLNYKSLKGLISEKYRELWQTTWESLTDCKISRQFITEVKPNKLTSKLSSGELQTLSQIMTGHGLFKRHLRHWNELPNNDYLCSLCGETWEDTWHLWAFCPTLSSERICAENSQKSKNSLRERAILNFFAEDKLIHLMASNEAILTPA